jgi:hypothetical protein
MEGVGRLLSLLSGHNRHDLVVIVVILVLVLLIVIMMPKRCCRTLCRRC